MKYLRRPMVFNTLSAVICLAFQNPPLALTQAPSLASARFRWSPTTSNGARFTSPTEGQIVHPGDTISINFDLDPKIENLVKGIAIMSSMGDLQFREAPPYSFTIAVPEKELRGVSSSLIGFQELHLSGVLVGREKNNADLATTTIDVEEPDL